MEKITLTQFFNKYKIKEMIINDWEDNLVHLRVLKRSTGEVVAEVISGEFESYGLAYERLLKFMNVDLYNSRNT